MRLSPLEIKKKEFQQKMRGFDPEEVQAFLTQVSEEMEQIVRERQEAEDHRLILDEKLSHYIGLEQSLERTLVAAQQTAVKIEEQAKREADLILKEAELQRDRKLNDIHSEFDRANMELVRVRTEYESTLARLRAILDGFSRFIQSVEEQKLAGTTNGTATAAAGPDVARTLASF
jgi:cell division initiation protein